ncbi:MAG: purine-nucleoside phosphorylase [bacterium]|nr:MAG: purine-nucleoside phosphorylase [bacterium]
MRERGSAALSPEELAGELFPEGDRPSWGLVLGSGFSAWAGRLTRTGQVPYSRVGRLGRPGTKGHPGVFVGGKAAGVPVVAATGRLHLYEGLTVDEVVRPVRIMAAMGVTSILFTTAVGGLDPGLEEGSAVTVSDHINLTGEDPHRGTGMFHDASSLYDPDYLSFLQGEGVRAGVLAGVRGPTYETPAEAGALRGLGADIVCMSTVLEVLTAAGAGLRSACLAVVGNRAGARGVDHEAVVENISRAAGMLWPAAERLIRYGSDPETASPGR